jgi:hypothetical protein
VQRKNTLGASPACACSFSNDYLDPGHAKKNLYKALQAMFGEKQSFDGLAARIPVFIMRLTKRAEKEHAENVADMRIQFLK